MEGTDELEVNMIVICIIFTLELFCRFASYFVTNAQKLQQNSTNASGQNTMKVKT